MVVFGLKLSIEPTGEIAQGFGQGLFGIFGRRLAGRAVARDVHRHGIFVIVAAAVADLGGELVEVSALDDLQAIGDAMQSRIRRGVVPDARGRALGVGPVALETDAPSPWLQKPENQMQGLARVPPPIRRTGVVLKRTPRISQTLSKSS